MGLADGVRTNLELVLDEVCRQLPNGGDHEVRKRIAEQLLEAAQTGQHSLAELRAVGLRSFAEAFKWTGRVG
ncbi:hypothetical protein GA0061098_103064 [Bradyrhizobium shewense]|uniref:Uncharacterized protein n=1 Tax=Bradyrhizobium shewense TaxID=1761772 RepID=A0A1C3XS03_9BRAD|nr:hypothetical protein GA0061098_103064 [Bradyrhizobium shewense]